MRGESVGDERVLETARTKNYDLAEKGQNESEKDNIEMGHFMQKAKTNSIIYLLEQKLAFTPLK